MPNPEPTTEPSTGACVGHISPEAWAGGPIARLRDGDPIRVVIDTRNPDAYAAGHIPGAVNLHEIFTFLSTSTPEGLAELKATFAMAFDSV